MISPRVADGLIMRYFSISFNELKTLSRREYGIMLQEVFNNPETNKEFSLLSAEDKAAADAEQLNELKRRNLL